MQYGFAQILILLGSIAAFVFKRKCIFGSYNFLQYLLFCVNAFWEYRQLKQGGVGALYFDA